MRNHAYRQGAAVYDAVGATRTLPTPPYPSTHNLGTCRMSEKARDGVVNKWGQAHDVANLFVRREGYRQGERIRGIVLEVRNDTKGPQIVMSRTHPDFLVQLFQMEVPEIYEGIVEVKGAAREPGDRAKIAVCSHNSEVDPVGACVGVKGSRVQSVVQELKGEKIDIVHWSEEQAVFVKNTLSPAQISRVVVDDDEHSMEVIVPDDQLSLAIGKKGQNVRLAVRLTGWRIDISTETDSSEGEKEALTPDEALKKEVELSNAAGAAQDSSAEGGAAGVGSLTGVGPKTMELLVEADFDSIEKIAGATVESLSEIDGIGPKKAETILNAAKEKAGE